MLALRNPLDVEAIETSGTRTSTLFGAPVAPAKIPETLPAPRRAPVAAAPPVVAPPPPPAPKRYSVEAIRGAKRTEETVQ
jgi:hypothetical protein